MPPSHGLVHPPPQHDIVDSNVELIGSDLDHKVKHASAESEPAWHAPGIGTAPGLHVWRVEQFEVKPWPRDRHGVFMDGDSFVVLHSFGVGEDKLGHDIFFWLGAHTTQDEAGTAAYKAVELDEFLSGRATQHRELQTSPSPSFLALFPRLSIRAGGVRTGFTHVVAPSEPAAPVLTLLRVFRSPHGASLVVHEVAPTWESLDDGDVFVLDAGDKIWVWQGRECSPMEKAKAAQVVHDMTTAKHVEVEVLAQEEARSRRVLSLLGADEGTPTRGLRRERPMGAAAVTATGEGQGGRTRKLYRLSDEAGELAFTLVRDGGGISKADLDGADVFLLDDGGRAVWVWIGDGASRGEKGAWLRVAQGYIQKLNRDEEHRVGEGYARAGSVPIGKVSEGSESKAFMKAIEV